MVTPTSGFTPTPGATPTLGPTPAFDSTLNLIPAVEPIQTPAPNLNRVTIDDLLSGYIEDILPGFDCLSDAGLGLDLKENIDVSFSAGKWKVNSSGLGCHGIEQTWMIDDATGEIEYLGAN